MWPIGGSVHHLIVRKDANVKILSGTPEDRARHYHHMYVHWFEEQANSFTKYANGYMNTMAMRTERVMRTLAAAERDWKELRRDTIRVEQAIRMGWMDVIRERVNQMQYNHLYLPVLYNTHEANRVVYYQSTQGILIAMNAKEDRHVYKGYSDSAHVNELAYGGFYVPPDSELRMLTSRGILLVAKDIHNKIRDYQRGTIDHIRLQVVLRWVHWLYSVVEELRREYPNGIGESYLDTERAQLDADLREMQKLGPEQKTIKIITSGDIVRVMTTKYGPQFQRAWKTALLAYTFYDARVVDERNQRYQRSRVKARVGNRRLKPLDYFNHLALKKTTANNALFQALDDYPVRFSATLGSSPVDAIFPYLDVFNIDVDHQNPIPGVAIPNGQDENPIKRGRSSGMSSEKQSREHQRPRVGSSGMATPPSQIHKMDVDPE